MYLLIDIGGTKTRIAVSESGAGFAEPRIFPTPQNFEEGISKIISTSKELLKNIRPKIISVGVAGPLNSKKTKLINSVNLEGWNQKPLHKQLFMEFGCDVIIENDAVLAGMGEAIYGAGKEHELVAYLTLSTGIGGSIFYNGDVLPNSRGYEPGHHIIDVINNQSLEQLAGGASLEKKYGKPPEEIKDPEIWDEVTYNIAVGIHNAILFWSPDIVVVGGGLVIHNAVKVPDLNKYLYEIVQIFPNMPKIEKSVFGETAGLYGALANSLKDL